MPPGWPGMLGTESSSLNSPSLHPMFVHATSGQKLAARLPLSRRIAATADSQQGEAWPHPLCSPHHPAAGGDEAACEWPGLHLLFREPLPKPTAFLPAEGDPASKALGGKRGELVVVDL